MGLVILIQVIMLFYYGRRQIQRGRTNPSQQMTLVSLIVAAICGLVEVLQGLQTLSACLHHADVNEQVRVLFYQKLCFNSNSSKSSKDCVDSACVIPRFMGHC